MLIFVSFVAVLLAQEPMAVPSPQPSPQATPLKQIIEVKARQLCTTLGRNVQIALVGLMKNDEVIESGRREFAKMAWDQKQGSAALGIDRLALKNVASAMVHNLYQIDQVLDDTARFPLTPSNADEASADRMKAALQAVETRQKEQLNVISGMVETEELSQMRHDIPAFNPTVNNPSQSSVPAPSPATIYDAGVSGVPKPAATTAPQTSAGSKSDTGVSGTAPAASFARELETGQTSDVELESEASSIIVPIAQECRTTPAATPSP